MDHPFNMYTIISMSTKILFYSTVIHIYWMENNPDGHLLKILACLLLYWSSNQVNIL